MKKIAKTDEEKTVTDYVINNFKGSGLVRLNLRTQWKAINTYKYSVAQGLDWKEEINSELKRVSKIRSMLYGLIGNEAVHKTELKKLLIKYELVPSIRMAEYKISEWIYTGEIEEFIKDAKDGYISLISREEWLEASK
jgi:hypothetical protein